MAGATQRHARGHACPSARTFIVIVVAALLCASAPRAAADEGDEAEARERAKELLDRGDEHLRHGNVLLTQRGQAGNAVAEFERALAAYQAAFDAFPESRIYYAIARAEEHLGRYLEAHRHYQLVLDDVDGLSDRLRAEVEHRQEAVRARIGALRLHLEPPEARLAIDGELVSRGPSGEPVYVNPGEHTIEISADNHRSRRLAVKVAEGETIQIVAALQPVMRLSDDDDGEFLLGAAYAKPSGPSKAPLVAGISLTAGLGLAATATGLFAVSQHGTFSDEARPSDERQSARDTGQIFAVTTDVLLIATAAAAGFTAYYYFGVYRGGVTAPEAAEVSSAPRSIWLAPYAGDESGGVALGGRF
jgi:tetratricopeptide (TPR) repeat protein